MERENIENTQYNIMHILGQKEHLHNKESAT